MEQITAIGALNLALDVGWKSPELWIMYAQAVSAERQAAALERIASVLERVTNNEMLSVAFWEQV